MALDRYLHFVVQLQGFVHKSLVCYECNTIWPLPKPFSLIHGFATKHRVATFEACTNISKLAFLKDLAVNGQRITPFSMWLEMMQEAVGILCFKSTNDTRILQNVVVGTTRDFMHSETTMLCSVDMTLGHASISNASGRHISAIIVNRIGRMLSLTRKPCSNKLILAQTFPKIKSFTKSIFAEIFLEQNASDFVAHPSLIQSSLTLPLVTSKASSIISCATITVEDTSYKAYKFGLTKKMTLSEYHQDLRCTKMNGQAVLRLCELQMKLPHEPVTGTSKMPALSLKWQPTAMLAFTPHSTTYPAPLRWLTLSEVPRSIGDLCDGIDRPVMVMAVVLNGHDSHCPFGLHLCNEDDLVYFLSLVAADNCLLVRSPHEDIGRTLQPSADFAMLWVYRAYARTLANIKLSLVDIRQRKGNALPEMSLSQGRFPIFTIFHRNAAIAISAFANHLAPPYGMHNTRSPNNRSCIVS